MGHVNTSVHTLTAGVSEPARCAHLVMLRCARSAARRTPEEPECGGDEAEVEVRMAAQEEDELERHAREVGCEYTIYSIQMRMPRRRWRLGGDECPLSTLPLSMPLSEADMEWEEGGGEGARAVLALVQSLWFFGV